MANDEYELLQIQNNERLLIYGIGNVGRQDDGLGIRLIEKLDKLPLPPSVSLEANYQLNIEDALLISDYDVVLFVDASVEKEKQIPFSIRPVQPCSTITFSTHAMSTGEVRYLCEALYHRKPRTYLLSLPGYEWEIQEELSKEARLNLDQAFQFLTKELGVTSCMKSP